MSEKLIQVDTILRGNEGSALLSEEQAKTIRDRRIIHHSDMFGHAATYDNAVVLGGYAAFFGLWAGVNEDVSPLCRAVTVSTMGISLLLYIIWQIGTMLVRQKGEWRRKKVFDLQDDAPLFNRKWTEVEKQNAIDNQSVMRFWRWIFFPQVVFGLAGGIILTYNAIALAFGLPQLR